MNINKIQLELEKRLKPERYRHTLGVAYTAASMAMVYDVDIQTAYKAGMLHDCAKAYSLTKQEVLCQKYGIELDDTMKSSPQLMHSALAPHIAHEEYGEQSEEILGAIECHTTGKINMSPLEQIVFIADYIEPNRKMIPGLKEVRKMAFLDLDLCTGRILKNTIEYLEENNQKIDGRTIETYEYYRTKIKTGE